MKVLGISPLDKDATASLVENGRVLFAAAEERYSRVKQQTGFPRRAVENALTATGTDPSEIEAVVYPFLTAPEEAALIHACLAEADAFRRHFRPPDLQRSLAEAEQRVPRRPESIPGLREPGQRMEKGRLKELFYRYAGGSAWLSGVAARQASRQWARRAAAEHAAWQQELEAGLAKLGLLGKLERYEHHLSHAASAYLASGLDRALVVTFDGYGTGLAGSASVGEGGNLRRLHNLRFPHSLGMFYQAVTSSLGFHPDRHAGKVVGLAAYGDREVLSGVLLGRMEQLPGDFRMRDNLNDFFSRHLACRFAMIDVAAAWQNVLEVLATSYVEHWVRQTGCRDVVLSGGVAANVKLNQRIHDLEAVGQTFVYPNMGDGGGGTGLAMLRSWPDEGRAPLRDVYHGPSFSPAEIRSVLEQAALSFSEPRDLPREIAHRLHRGEVIGRFDGRMEYGPRALGNRSILCHARDPAVNQWLNERLGRTEFMPFAPVVAWEAAGRCFEGLSGAEHAAEFMTITFICSEWMRSTCPAAVHIDGTARPQLIRREVNPAYYDIIREYERLSGIPCLINTSFNLHEEPIVCTPGDAVRAFLQGGLDGLAIGPYYVENPRKQTVSREALSGSRAR